MSGLQRSARAECWIVLLVAVAVYVPVAVYLTLALDKVDWAAVATTSRAFDVVFGGEQPGLSRIGFAEPPLPGLLQIPLVAAMPHLGARALAAPLAAAVLAALACVLLCKVMAETGAPRWLRWLLLLGFGFNPTWLYAAATGLMMAPLVCFLALACGLYLARWAREGVLRDLVMCGLIASAAFIAHLEAAALTVAMALAVGLIVRADRRGDWSEVEGTLITLLLPAAAVAAVWTGTCWAIMGDPLYSLRGGAGADRIWLLALEGTLFASFVLWCRRTATETRPLLAGLTPTLIMAATGALIAGWDGTAPSPWAGYGYLQPVQEDVQTFTDFRRLGSAAANAAGDGLVIVDSDMAFAISLASGRPRSFVAADLLHRRKAGDKLRLATHVLTDLTAAPPAADGTAPPDTRVNGFLGGRRLVRVWSVGQWRLFRLPADVE